MMPTIEGRMIMHTGRRMRLELATEASSDFGILIVVGSPVED